MREIEGASVFSPLHKTHTHTHNGKSSALLLPGGGSSTRRRLRTETFNGAIVSGTWPDPDPFYTTKPLEVCQSHTRTHTNGDGQPWCYSGAILKLLSMLLLGLLLNFGRLSKANRPGDVISQPCRFSREQAMHTHAHTNTRHLGMHVFLQTHTRHTHKHTDTLIWILTSRSVNA